MLSSVCIGTDDLSAATAFYDPVLATIGLTRIINGDHEVGYAPEGLPDASPHVWVVRPYDGQAARAGNGVQFLFAADGADAVDAFHAAILTQGGTDEGAPGPRDYMPGYYGAYGRDAVGNKLHAFCIVAAAASEGTAALGKGPEREAP
ncbi:MAG: VOC family protein [Pseudomonadota bacterium]